MIDSKTVLLYVFHELFNYNTFPFKLCGFKLEMPQCYKDRKKFSKSVNCFRYKYVILIGVDRMGG